MQQSFYIRISSYRILLWSEKLSLDACMPMRHGYDPKMSSNSISKHLLFKIFSGGHALRSPSISMLPMLIVLHTIMIILNSQPGRSTAGWPDRWKIASYGPVLYQTLELTISLIISFSAMIVMGWNDKIGRSLTEAVISFSRKAIFMMYLLVCIMTPLLLEQSVSQKWKRIVSMRLSYKST